MNNIMQSDQQLTAAEKVAQEAESKKREAELKAEMEKKAREEMEAVSYTHLTLPTIYSV